MNCRIYVSGSFDPFFNLAFEDLLFDSVNTDQTAILYLWQNKDTVVIGKSQNAWQECRSELLEADGGRLARRTSGGGAVFHDLGNLCYTFICSEDVYDLERQLRVILSAVGKCGIAAEFTGRNDIVAADGRKFSGNAFRFSKKVGMMHGTVLVDTDAVKIGKYLNVSPAKIESKGITSVRSRVVNLKELSPAVTVPQVKTEIINAFCEEYGYAEREAENISPLESEIEADGEKIALVSLTADIDGSDGFYKRYQKFASWEWRYGSTMRFGTETERKFGWGLVKICMNVEHGIITDCMVYTDSMDALTGEVLSAGLKGTRLCAEDVRNAVRTSASIMKSTGKMLLDPVLFENDVCSMINEL